MSLTRSLSRHLEASEYDKRIALYIQNGLETVDVESKGLGGEMTGKFQTLGFDESCVIAFSQDM